MKPKQKYGVGKSIQYQVFFWILTGFLVALFATRGSLVQATQTASPDPADWSGYLSNNGRNGFNGAETIINPATAANLKLHWMFHAKGPISAQPVEANGIIYWGSWDGYEHATSLDGTPLWTAYLGKTTDPDCSPASVGVTSTATVASVAIHGQTTALVFVGGGDAHFYALDALSGKALWKISLGSSPSYFIWGSPVVYKGSVYIGIASFGDCPAVQGQLFQLNAATGSIQHTFKVVPNGCIGGGIWSSPTIDNSTGKLYITTGSPDRCWTTEIYVSAIIELSAANLALVTFWQVPYSEWVIDSDFGASPTLFTATIKGVPRSLVGAAHKNGIYYAFLRGALGKGPVWQAIVALGGSDPTKGDGSISPSAWDGSRLYVAGGRTAIHGAKCKGSVRALNPATGAFLWEHCLTDGPVLAPVTAVPGVVVVEEGFAVLLINAVTGKTLFVYKDANRSAPFYSGSSISNGVLYVGSFDDNLYAFGL